MKKIKIIICSFVLCCFLLIGIADPVAAYSPSAAVNYANTYWHIYNWPTYSSYPGGDCTNFVSQILHAGGLSTNSTWTPYTAAWINANSFKNYVKNNLGATKLASGWRKVAHYNSSGIWYYAYVNNSANIPSTADVCIFYDWNDNGIIDHSSYCVGTGTSSDDTGYGDLIDQHTNDRYKTIWTLDQWNDTHRYTVAIYAFQL